MNLQQSLYTNKWIPAFAGMTIMSALLHPSYFPNIAHFAIIVQHNNFEFEVYDNYSKQTYRNRTCIYGANGKLQLNIPIHHTQKHRQLYKDVKIANDIKWQSQHFKSLESAYKTSPFFEYYEDDLRPLFERKVMFLMDFNLKCFEVISDILELELRFTETEYYTSNIAKDKDFRNLINCKKEIHQDFEPYTQVFDSKHGFIPNLSILDLLFNEGPNSVMYLEQQSVKN